MIPKLSLDIIELFGRLIMLKKVISIKNLWKGIFLYKCEVQILYCYAYSSSQAKIIMARRIARKQGVLPVVVLGWLKDHPNSFEIKIETEFKEVDDEE